MTTLRQNPERIYYASPAPITRLETHRVFAERITDDIDAIFRIVQGLVVHDGWVAAYGIEFDDAQRYDFSTLTMEVLLDRAVELGGERLEIPRGPDRRVIGCCRDFATLMVAILRAKGVPARSRCGFVSYFDDTPKWEDHWLCEYWSKVEGRWVFADPQMDPFQQSVLKLDFSPLDVPRDRFLSGGEAWRRCRAGQLNPGDFGIGDEPATYGLASLYGLWFVRGNLLRDVAALNRVELVPLLMRLWRGLDWSAWRLVGAEDDELSSSDWALLDRASELACKTSDGFGELRALYRDCADLRPASPILRYEA